MLIPSGPSSMSAPRTSSSFPEDGSMKITSMARTGNAPSRKRKAVNSRRRVMIVYLQKFSAIRLQFVQALLQILSRRCGVQEILEVFLLLRIEAERLGGIDQCFQEALEAFLVLLAAQRWLVVNQAGEKLRHPHHEVVALHR